MLYFVTVNYHSQALVAELIATLATDITRAYQVVVVNNSPTAPYQPAPDLASPSGPIHIIEAGENLGFGRACNLGLSHIWQQDPSAVVWLINPDAQIDPQGDRPPLAALATEPDIAILGTQIRDDVGALWFGSGHFNPWTGALGHGPPPGSNSGLTCPTAWVTGCSLILNLAAFDQCPEFDPAYFLYGEDAEFCLRYRRQGYRVAVTAQVLVTHRASSIIGRNRQAMYTYYTWGRLRVLRQHGTPLGLGLYLGGSLVKAGLGLLRSDSTPRTEALGRWQGIVRFLLGRSAQAPGPRA